MSAPEFCKEFDIEAAKAGAPLCCRGGRKEIVLKFDCNSPEKLVGVYDDDDSPTSWVETGRYRCGFEMSPFDLVMLPLGMIDGKPVYWGDSVCDSCGDVFAADMIMHFSQHGWWSWPQPAVEYPKTTLTSAELIRNFNRTYHLMNSLEGFANYVLRHAVETGQLVVPEKAS